MQGTIVINAEAGRALRKTRAAVLVVDVLDCAGAFRVGDRVHVVVRGSNGSQGVVASGIVRCDAELMKSAMRRAIDTVAETDAAKPDVAKPDVARHDPAIVIAGHDIELLWQTGM